MRTYPELVQICKDRVGDQIERLFKTRLYVEYEDDFLGFLNVYDLAWDFTKDGWTILDLGGYLGVQACLFEGTCAEYINVDIEQGPRVELPFVRNFYGTSEEFLTKNPGILFRDDVMCICSYNPDRYSQRACKAFDHHCLVYPGAPSSVKGVCEVRVGKRQ